MRSRVGERLIVIGWMWLALTQPVHGHASVLPPGEADLPRVAPPSSLSPKVYFPSIPNQVSLWSTALLEERFDDPASGWQQQTQSEGECGYDQGTYRVTVNRQNWMVWGRYNAPFEDLSFSADVRAGENLTDGNAFLLFRVVDDANFYRFQIALPLQAFAIDKSVNGQWQTFVPWTWSSDILTGTAQANLMRVDVIGKRAITSVNGHFLATVTDDALAQAPFRLGGIGVGVGNYAGSAGATALFDNVTVNGRHPLLVSVPVLPGAPLYSDDFARTSTGWPQVTALGFAYGYGGGGYFIRSMEPGFAVRASRFGLTFADADTRVKVRAAGSEVDGVYGLAFRVQPDGGHSYVFWVDPGSGRFRLDRYAERVWSSLIDWQPSSYIRLGYATNELRVISQGSSLRLFVNDHPLTEEPITDATFASGILTLINWNWRAPEGFATHFDDLQVFEPAAQPMVEGHLR